ncbi:MAG: M48 family metallopeptidase [Flavobacteriales bacterium]|nr:M48 family metallopeptidase [Flavobacteriales bacterium]
MGTVQYGTTPIVYSVQFRTRRTLGIEVHPDRSVVVLAPAGIAPDVIRQRVLRRGAWITRQQRYFERFLPGRPAREGIAGETWSYLGRRHVLRIRRSDQPCVKLTRGELIVYLPDTTDRALVKRQLAAWYHAHTRKRFNAEVLAALEILRAHHPVRTPKLAYRTMLRRWGSCTAAGVLVLNPDLVQTPVMCIRYVILHELCHLVHHHHGKAFYNLLERVMPDWKRWKDRLERSV